VGTLVVGLIYLLVSTPVALLLPGAEVATSNAPLALFVERYWSPNFGLFIGLFAAVSVVGTLNGLTLLQGELPLAMARHGAFPAWFAVTSRRGTAVRAQLLSTSLATLLLLFNATRSLGGLFTFMALLSTTAALILYLACALSALRLQQTRRMARSWTLGTLAALAALYSVWTLYGAGYEATGWGAALLVAGAPVYWLMRRASRLRSTAALIRYLACALSALRLQQTRQMARSWTLGTLAALAALYSLWTLYGAGYEATGWGAALLVAGAPVYWLMRRASRLRSTAAME
jgi:APA family basic amino acid/polyamine antiporter